MTDTTSTEAPMAKLTYKLADETDLDDLYQMMQDESSDYINDSLWKLGMTDGLYRAKFESVGDVYNIYCEGDLAGFYWVEKREDVLHLHAIILRGQYQGQGLGRQAMEAIIEEHRFGMKTMELGVYHDNFAARRLYEKMGFDVVRFMDDVQFYIMQKDLVSDRQA